jgi:hypothetical protein
MTRLLTAPKRTLPVARLIVTLFAAILALTMLFALVRAGVFYSLYTSLFARVVEATGLDLWASRALALLLLGVVLILPWHILILPWVGGVGRKAALWLVVTALAFAAMEFATRDVYFSRADGHPLRYYLRTLDGYKFAAAPGTDPVYGINYQPITAAVAKEYLLWQKRGGKMQDPGLPESQFFSPSTGDALRWYARRPDGKIDVFTLPGFHPTFGTKLLPVDAAVVAEYEQQQAEAERKAQVERERKRAEAEQQRAETERQKAERERQTAEEERQRAERERQESARRAREAEARRAREEAARLRQPLRAGRYLFASPPWGTVDGMKFTLTEIDLTAQTMLAHVAVENMGTDISLVDLWRNRNVPRYIRFGLVDEDGVSSAYTAIHAKEGALTERDGSVSFPAPGSRGAFVMQFAAPTARTFSLTINDEPLFSGLNLRTARYETF